MHFIQIYGFTDYIITNQITNHVLYRYTNINTTQPQHHNNHHLILLVFIRENENNTNSKPVTLHRRGELLSSFSQTIFTFCNDAKCINYYNYKVRSIRLYKTQIFICNEETGQDSFHRWQTWLLNYGLNVSISLERAPENKAKQKIQIMCIKCHIEKTETLWMFDLHFGQTLTKQHKI